MKGTTTNASRPKTEAAFSAASLQTASGATTSPAQEGRTPDKADRKVGVDVVDSGDSDTKRRSRAARSVPQSSRKRGSRLTGEAQARLRGDDNPADRLAELKKLNQPVGDLQPLEPRQQIAQQNYSRGYADGFEQGQADGGAMERRRIAQEVKPDRRINFWRTVCIAVAAFALGQLIGTVL